MKVVVFGEKNGVACHDVYDFTELKDVASCLAEAEKKAVSAGLKNVISMTEGQAKLFISGVIRNLNYPEDSLELDFELKDSSHRDESNIGLKMKVKNEGLELSFDGHCGYHSSAPAPQLSVQFHDGEVHVRVYADANFCGPTHDICMDAAREVRRHRVA